MSRQGLHHLNLKIDSIRLKMKKEELRNEKRNRISIRIREALIKHRDNQDAKRLNNHTEIMDRFKKQIELMEDQMSKILETMNKSLQSEIDRNNNIIQSNSE